MYRYIKSIALVVCSLHIYILQSQSEFNIEFLRDFGCTGVDMLYEDSSYYYTIGYAQANGKAEVGLVVNTHEKRSGEINHSAYFDVEGVWLSVGSRTGVIALGDTLYFCFSGRGVVYLLNYNTDTKNISVRDTVVTNGGFLFDLVMDADSSMICIYESIDSEQKGVGRITKFRKDGTKLHFNVDNSEMIRSPGKLIKRENGNWYYHTQWNPTFIDNYLVVAELDSEFNILWTWKSPWVDRVFAVDNILALPNDQVLILMIGHTHDSIMDERAFVHWVYRYDLKERKVLWRRNYGQPPSRDITHGGQIVASQRDENTWLMCTSAVLAGSTKQHYVIIGRAAKFKENGDVIWSKDYSLFQDENLNRNYFVSMMQTSDRNYLLGGFYLGGGCRSWLVKIDEDGHVLPRDTTSSSADYVPIDEMATIKIYPNPVSDILYISQSAVSLVQYNLVDMQGACYRSIFVSGTDTEIMWDISTLPSGTYVLVAESDSRRIGSRKIVKR